MIIKNFNTTDIPLNMYLKYVSIIGLTIITISIILLILMRIKNKYYVLNSSTKIKTLVKTIVITAIILLTGIMDHQFFGSILTDLYIEDTLIKSLYNENEQKIFYNYLNELLTIYYKKHHHHLLNQPSKMYKEDSLKVTLNTLKSFLSTEEIESIKIPTELIKTITNRNIKKINNHIFNTHPGIMLHYIDFFDDIKKHTKKLIDSLVELNIIEIIN